MYELSDFTHLQDRPPDPILEAAWAYHEAGYCVLPVTKNKTPYLKWESYQERWRREGQSLGPVS